MARTFPRLFRAAVNLHPSPVDLSMIMDLRITQILTAGDQGIEPRCDAPEAPALPLSQSPNRFSFKCLLVPRRGPLSSLSKYLPFLSLPGGLAANRTRPDALRERCSALELRAHHNHLPPFAPLFVFISLPLVGSMGYDPIVFRLKAGGFLHLSYEPNRFGPVCFNFFKPGFDIFVFRAGGGIRTPNDPKAVAFTAR